VCGPAELAASQVFPFPQSAVAMLHAAVSCRRDLAESGCARRVCWRPCVLFAFLFLFLRKSEIRRMRKA
jgi:hypothetical protein